MQVVLTNIQWLLFVAEKGSVIALLAPPSRRQRFDSWSVLECLSAANWQVCKHWIKRCDVARILSLWQPVLKGRVLAVLRSEGVTAWGWLWGGDFHLLMESIWRSLLAILGLLFQSLCCGASYTLFKVHNAFGCSCVFTSQKSIMSLTSFGAKIFCG